MTIEDSYNLNFVKRTDSFVFKGERTMSVLILEMNCILLFLQKTIILHESYSFLLIITKLKWQDSNYAVTKSLHLLITSLNESLNGLRTCLSLKLTPVCQFIIWLGTNKYKTTSVKFFPDPFFRVLLKN